MLVHGKAAVVAHLLVTHRVVETEVAGAARVAAVDAIEPFVTIAVAIPAATVVTAILGAKIQLELPHVV
jgi:hypothetical protein